MEKNKTFELCDVCGQETEIDNKVGGYCSTCGKFLKPCSMCDMDKVNCNECKFKIPKKYVYVVIENGSWDYETTNSVSVFDNFEKALKEYQDLIQTTKQDMEEWADEEDLDIEENIDKDNESASFSMYECGDYSRLHNDIVIEKQEIL